MGFISGGTGARQLPLYAATNRRSRARLLVKVDCVACHHVPLLRPEALLRVGLAPRPTFFTSKAAVAVRQEGAGDGSVKGRAHGA